MSANPSESMGEESDRVPEMFPDSSEYEKRRARRYSTGSTILRYLGPSPGSCHDFCKYGNRKEETRPAVRSVILNGRMAMKLSGCSGSEEEIPSIGLIKDEPKAKRMNSNPEAKKKASSSQQPKSTMRGIPASSRAPYESHVLQAKVKPIMTVNTRKSIAPSIHSVASTKAREMNKAAQSGGGNKEEVRGEELCSDTGKDENEASESTDCHSTRGFSEVQENGSSCKFSDFNVSDEVDDATEVEDEAEMNNRSTEDACRAEKLNIKREKVNGPQSQIHCLRRLKFRSHPDDDDDEREDNGYLSDPGSTTVALRRQQLQEKKAARRSLNDMIEETAVKLSRTQKSKVKALVGAFESVISLQDINPSANNRKRDSTSQPQSIIAVEVGRV